MTGLQAQIDLLKSNLSAVSELRSKAIEAFPIIEKNLEDLTTGFTKSVDEAVTRSSKALTDSEASQAKLETGYASLLQDSDKAQERFSTAISVAMTQMADQTAASFEQHGKLIETGSREANQAISESWAQNGEKMNSQFADFDTQMQQELTRCIELLGRQLAAVSQKLVDDYSQLMQNLNTAVNIAEFKATSEAALATADLNVWIEEILSIEALRSEVGSIIGRVRFL